MIYCDIFTKNAYSAKDYFYSNLQQFIKDDISVEGMINNYIPKEGYVETKDNTLQDLKHSRDFLYRNFKNNEHYNKMYLT